MAIPLGRTLNDPSFMFWQIIVTIALFLISLGLSAYLLNGLSFLLSSGEPLQSNDSTTVWDRMWSSCYIPLQQLFTPFHASHRRAAGGSGHPTVHSYSLSSSTSTSLAAAEVPVVTSGAEVRFFTLHIMAGLMSAAPIAYFIQRSKFVADFTATVYLVYLILSWVVVRAFPWSLWWWFSVGCGAACLYGLTTVLCRRREAQDILVGSAASVSTSSLSSVAHGGSAIGAPGLFTSSAGGGSGGNSSSVAGGGLSVASGIAIFMGGTGGIGTSATSSVTASREPLLVKGRGIPDDAGVSSSSKTE